MNRYPFNQCCYLYLARGLMAFGVILIASKPAMADVLFLGVDKEAELVNNNTTAIVTGRVACSDGEMYNVGAVVVQDQGALLANAIGTGSLVPLEDSLPCSESPIPFEVLVPVVIPRNGTFAEGPAEARVSALATGDPAGSDTQSVDTTLDLKAVGP